ncbi:two-component system sensor histidine kinase DesK [Alkalibacillus filiformis]|uniref:histidine kinase n=1 Tax=Alkalibacillus filiformis TaxID=200990 RepID=A0ABU0DV73_9BACI|nr:sensor histidine kinase [Alkalibacillus filiformis]MDQ0352239.1 two-component system sensor histidine kinase DesK [Alkalibacillus filiformis]
MQNWFNIIPRNLSLNIYVWVIFSFLPFFFIFRSNSLVEIILGIVSILTFFLAYRLSFLSDGWSVYVWVSIKIVISVAMTLFYGYVYVSLFLAYFIGNIQQKAGFLTLYITHLVTTLVAVYGSFFTQTELFFTQLPFIIITIIGVVLLPFNTYNRIKREKLEGELEDANQKISQLIVFEERQRIARDLHDTLGQKLSLIGLKSDLAGKLVAVDQDKAIEEMRDINQTARTALKEVRDMVSDMRGVRLDEEIHHVQQLLEAAEIEYQVEGDQKLEDTPLLIEDVASMCLKEAVTNVVKHSQATYCQINVLEKEEQLVIIIEDNGVGIPNEVIDSSNSGIRGMRERLEFVNGVLEVGGEHGTTLKIVIPKAVKQDDTGVI